MEESGTVQGAARTLDAVGSAQTDPQRNLWSVNGVLAMVVTSTMLTACSGVVVFQNALDARRAALVDVVAGGAERPQRAAPDASAAQPMPVAETLTVALAPEPDLAPVSRTAPGLPPITRETPPETGAPAPGVPRAAAVRIIEGAPPITPRPRPDVAGRLEVVAMARGMSPVQALALPRPTTRPQALPGQIAALGAPAGATEDAEALTFTSPRPLTRPNDLVVAVAARPDTLDIDVARAEGASAIDPLGELPTGNLFAGGGNGDCGRGLTRAIPRRPNAAASGSAVMAAVGNGSGSARDNRLVQEALAGNIPNHLRGLVPVTMRGTVGGRSVTVTLCVTPDYLAIGSDRDHVRVPLGLPAALRLADAFDMMLPTTTMVDAIYRQADVRVAPSPMTPGSAMSSTNYFVRHDETLDAQLARAGARPGQLVAGHKKDLVLANRLSRNPGRVAIYGWHRTNGNPIQPLSTVHGEYYADYSHGIRLVSRTAYVDGRAVDLRDLLTDDRYASFLNSDGTLTGATIRLASR